MDNKQMSHEPMEVLEEYMDVSRENEHNALMTPFKEYEERKREWKEEKTIFEMRLKAESQKFKDMEDSFNRAIQTVEQMNKVNVDQLTNENQLLKHLLSNLHKYATTLPELDDSVFEQPSTLKPDSPESNLYQQTQDIYNKLKEIREIESELESAGKQLFKLLSIILGDKGHHKMVTTGCEKRTKAASQSVLKHPDSHNENFQFALSELEQMKQKSRECEVLHQRLNEVNETVLKSESDMIALNKAWRETYLKLQQDKERELLEITTKWINHCKEQDQHHSKENEQVHHSVEILMSEKDELLTRLSKIAADRLQHGNVDIADLSDPDRPTKLQDVYTELYDNEWTDAFEELMEQRNVSDTCAIRMLLDILMCSFRMCREITWCRYEKLKNVLASIVIAERNPFSSAMKVMSDVPDPGLVNQEKNTREQFGNNNEIEDQKVAKESEELLGPNLGASSKNKIENEKEMRFECSLDLDISLEKQIKDIWQRTTMALKEKGLKQLSYVMETSMDIPYRFLPMTSKYLMICIDLCWKMGVKEKPLHLDCVAEKGVGAEKRFDNGKFRPYTQSGENVDFVVWPALFLHEGGPMLVKGVAQGCSSNKK